MRIANPAGRLTDTDNHRIKIREQDAASCSRIFLSPSPFHFFTKITRIVKIETLC